MQASIDALDEICRICDGDGLLPEDLKSWMARALGRFLSQECDNLNEAFGLAQGRGGVPWWREKAIRERDAALRDLARDAFADLPVPARAREIARLARRYGGTAWPRDRLAGKMPRHHVGTPQAHLWRAFRSGAKMPVTERHLRTLLAE